MTEKNRLKKKVRSRMAETGESYTAARAAMSKDSEPESTGRSRTLCNAQAAALPGRKGLMCSREHGHAGQTHVRLFKHGSTYSAFAFVDGELPRSVHPECATCHELLENCACDVPAGTPDAPDRTNLPPLNAVGLCTVCVRRPKERPIEGERTCTCVAHCKACKKVVEDCGCDDPHEVFFPAPGTWYGVCSCSPDDKPAGSSGCGSQNCMHYRPGEDQYLFGTAPDAVRGRTEHVAYLDDENLVRRIECIFCHAKFDGLEGLKRHSARCDEHPAVKALRAQTRADLEAELKPKPRVMMEKALAAWGITLTPDGKLLRSDGTEIEKAWREDDLEDFQPVLSDAEGELARHLLNEVFRAEVEPRKPEVVSPRLGIEIKPMERVLMESARKMAPKDEERPAAPAPTELPRAKASEEELALMEAAMANQPPCTCGPDEEVSRRCLFHHPPVVTEPLVIEAPPVIAKGGLSEPGHVDVAKNVVERLLRDHPFGKRGEQTVVHVDVGDLPPTEAAKVVAGIKTEFEAQPKCPPMDKNGLCVMCGRMPHACDCKADPPGTTYARCPKTACAKVYRMYPTKSRVCEHCGQPGVEVIDPDAEARPMAQAPQYLTAKQEDWAPTIPPDFKRKSCGHIGEATHCEVCRAERDSKHTVTVILNGEKREMLKGTVLSYQSVIGMLGFQKCDACDSDGRKWSSPTENCPSCQGSGHKGAGGLSMTFHYKSARDAVECASNERQSGTMHAGPDSPLLKVAQGLAISGMHTGNA
jgi:hypothetical protein